MITMIKFRKIFSNIHEMMVIKNVFIKYAGLTNRGEVHNIIDRRLLLEKQTRKNAFVYEVRAVMGSGEHGGSQRWQLTIIHLAKAKESCVFD